MGQSDVLFLLLGAIMILSMHAGFAFLEAGTVSYKNQVNAFNKILFDWSTTTLIYFLIGFPLAYGTFLYLDAKALTDSNGFELVRFFFLVGFAACIPAIISGGVVGRMKFYAQSIAGVCLAAVIYPLCESLVWGRIPFMGQEGSLFESLFGTVFHDFAGSVVVHSTGGWIALAAVIILGPRKGRYSGSFDIRPSSIPYLSLGSWILIVGWFGFNVMSSQKLADISGLVAINSLMAMVGGCIAGLLFSKNDVGFTHNGALAGLIAICAGSDVVHPLAALFIGAIAGLIFVKGFSFETEKLKIDDVLGVWPLHGICGTWGGIAAGMFGHQALGAVSDLSFLAQLSGSLLGAAYAFGAGYILYTIINKTYGLRMTEEEEFNGSDLTFHNVEANASNSVFASGPQKK
ncbi:MAG: ammonium transporter [Fibrobacteria bacterium]|nr:ammonium transporter [Fibrobacteria bacterium]